MPIPNNAVYNFDECLKKSNSLNKTERAINVIRQYFVQSTKVEKHNGLGNDHGTDFIATNEHGFHARVDVKNWRTNDGANGKYVLLEIMSSYEHEKIGWSLDLTKNTEYICYIFGNNDSLIVPFPVLLNTTILCAKYWIVNGGYNIYPVRNDTYRTFCININKKDFLKHMCLVQCGINPITLKNIKPEELVMDVQLAKEICNTKSEGMSVREDIFKSI